MALAERKKKVIELLKEVSSKIATGLPSTLEYPKESGGLTQMMQYLETFEKSKTFAAAAIPSSNYNVPRDTRGISEVLAHIRQSADSVRSFLERDANVRVLDKETDVVKFLHLFVMNVIDQVRGSALPPNF